MKSLHHISNHSLFIADMRVITMDYFLLLCIIFTHLSILVLQIMLHCYAVGAPIGFFRGDPLLLFEDIIALRPTIMATVPRVFNRIYDKIVGGILKQGGLKLALFRKACEQKVAGLYHGRSTHALWDRLIFNKVGKWSTCVVYILGVPHIPIGFTHRRFDR